MPVAKANLMEIEKVVRKFKMGEEPTDFAYWQGRPVEERLQALREIRREFHEWKYGDEPEFERVLKVTRPSRG